LFPSGLVYSPDYNVDMVGGE